MATSPTPTGDRTTRPTVSIGVPVYNGEQHIAQAIESLLGQTFDDFEIVISDNASTDRTEEICRGFAARDPRVRYVRQPRNIGAPRNWNVVVEEARGEYFKWASANDYCSANYVDDCLRALRDDPRLVMCYGTTCLVDEVSGAQQRYDGDLELMEERPSQRFRRVSRDWALNNAQSGLFRLAVLRRTGLDRPYVAGDVVLMAELALYGCFGRVRSATLFRRSGGASMSSSLTPAQLRALINPLASREELTAWPRHRDLFDSILRAPIAVSEKLACLGIAARGALWDRPRLGRELGMVLRRAVQRTPRPG